MNNLKLRKKLQKINHACGDCGGYGTVEVIEESIGLGSYPDVDTCESCKGTGTNETTLEERLGNILFESIGIKSKGIVDRTLEQNLFVDNENILDFIKQELQQERERIVKEINNIPTHFDEGQGAVGRYSYKIIKAINQDHE